MPKVENTLVYRAARKEVYVRVSGFSNLTPIGFGLWMDCAEQVRIKKGKYYESFFIDAQALKFLQKFLAKVLTSPKTLS